MMTKGIDGLLNEENNDDTELLIDQSIFILKIIL